MRTSLPFKLLFISSALFGLIAVSARPQASAIYGRVEFRGAAPAPAYNDNFLAYRPPRSHQAAKSSPGPPLAVVYLEDREGKLAPSPHQAPAAIDQRNESFLPRILAVQTGTRVDFPNSDPIYHNVFSLSKGKRFDLGRYPRGESRSVIFDREGLVRIFCEIHSHMSAFVLVLPHPYFATTDGSGDDAGSYRIDNIPAGNYGVVVWNDHFRPARRLVEVSGSDEIQLDFVLQRLR